MIAKERRLIIYYKTLLFKMGNTLFIGNGLNRINITNPKWEELLQKITSRDLLIPHISNTLQYEDIYLTKDINPITANVSYKETTEYLLKKQISESFNGFTTNDIYKRILRLPIENIITTNYDHVIDETLKDAGYVVNDKKSDNSENVYNIHRKRCLIVSSNERRDIWRIHGDMAAPRSIMLGYDHYCAQTARYNSYIKGQYELNGKKVESMLARLNDLDSFKILSWIDLFFTSNVHIVGFGLSYDEMDIWWILNKRIRLIKEGVLSIENAISFYGIEIDESKEKLLEDFGVHVHNIQNPVDGNYETSYKQIINQISEEIE